jgi:preprotein translocase subunit SecF
MRLHYLELVPPNTNINFIGYRRIAVALSLIANLIVLAGVIFWPGLKYGVDFAGGTEIELKFTREVDVGELRTKIGALGFGEPSVQVYGDPSEHSFLVRVERVALLSTETAAAAHEKVKGVLPGLKSWDFDVEVGDKIDLVFEQPVDAAALRSALDGAGVRVKEVRPLKQREGEPAEYLVLAQGPGDRIGEELRGAYGADAVEVRRVEYVGPAVGKQLRVEGTKAFLYAILAIVIYCAFRFDFRFAPGVIVALFHDGIIVLGFYLFAQREFNLTALAAVLTVIGYSVNDTIVVYDRIRENISKHRGKTLPDLINLSTNEMLGRTALTGGTTILALVGFLIFGVGSIWDFSMAVIIGVIVGTYSSVYIAGPTTIFLEELFSKGEKAPERRAAGAAG